MHGEPERKRTQAKYRAAANRVKDPRTALRLVIQQRVHVDDLTGYLIARATAAVPVEVFSLPLQFDPDRRCHTFWGWCDPRVHAGEVLHAARFTDEVIAQALVDKGPHAFAAVYNQAPDNLEGGMFARAWLRFWRPVGEADDAGLSRPPGCRTRADLPSVCLPLRFDWVSVSVDATFGSLEDSASRVGLLVFGGRGADRYLLADRTRRMTFHDTCREISAIVAEQPGIKTILIEKKANGAAVIERLEEWVHEGKMRGVMVVALETDGGKAARAYSIVPDVYGGHLYLRDGAPYLAGGRDGDDQGFVHEFCGFPNGRKDDRVDATTQLFRHYAGVRGFAWASGLKDGGKLPAARA